MSPLEGTRIASTALNVPGPVACARLRELGAAVVKVEPPSGDPLERYCPEWYGALRQDMETRRVDLKADAGRAQLHEILAHSDVLLTAQRPSALARLGLDAPGLAARYPRLCVVNIVGHEAPHAETAGHDLTYLARHGLVFPPALPPTLFADLGGAERAVSTALALLLARERSGRGASRTVALESAAEALAQPLRHGLTSPGALLGGGLAGYNLYATRAGWIAVAALEPHFAARLAESLALPELTIDALRARFAQDDAASWERWARERDLPLVALKIFPEG